MWTGIGSMALENKHRPGQGVLQRTAVSAAICWAEPDETASEAAEPEPTPQLFEVKDWQEKERRCWLKEEQGENSSAFEHQWLAGLLNNISFVGGGGGLGGSLIIF